MAQRGVWVRGDVADHCLTGISLPTKYTVKNLLAAQAALIQEGCVTIKPASLTAVGTSPRLGLRLQRWIPVAKEKLGLGAADAEGLFLTFRNVDDVDVSERLHESRLELGCQSDEQKREFHLRKSVPLARFMLFLLIQLFPLTKRQLSSDPHTSHSISTLQTSGDTWPGASEGPMSPTAAFRHLSPSRSNVLHTRVADPPMTFSAFLLQHIREAVSLLCSTDSEAVSRLELDELSFLLRCSLEPPPSFSPSSPTSGDPSKPFAPELIHTEYSVAENSPTEWWRQNPSGRVPVSNVVQWLEQALTQVDAEYLTHMIRECYDLGAPGSALRSMSLGSTGGSTNSSMSFSSSKGHAGLNLTATAGVNVIAGVSKKNVFRYEDDLEICSRVVILNCHHTVVYLLHPVRFVDIVGCSNCTVVTGPIVGDVVMQCCENVQMSTICRALRIYNSTSCTLFACPNEKVIVSASCRGLLVGPYNTFYASIEDHLIKGGINPFLSRHADLLLLTQTNASPDAKVSIAKVLPPSAYYLSTIPVQLEGTTQSNPCYVPEEYLEALENRQQKVSDICTELRTAMESRADADELQKYIQSQFKEWLVKSGNFRQIVDLANHTDNTAKPSGDVEGDGK